MNDAFKKIYTKGFQNDTPIYSLGKLINASTFVICMNIYLKWHIYD